MAYTISPEQNAFFEQNGYLIERNIMSTDEAKILQQWAQEVHDLPRTRESPWMPYEEINALGERVLCRTENYANYHADFNALLRGDKILRTLALLAGEDMLLSKEKSKGPRLRRRLACWLNFEQSTINLRAREQHLDSTAYTHVKNIKHLTILIAVDASNLTNGGVEVVEGSHSMDVPIDRTDNCIEKSWKWVPVELEAGDVLIFGSYLAHRSGANNSKVDRKAIYATFNCKSEGDLHDAYYADRAKLWPPTHKREKGEKYEAGAFRYGFGSPMLSVDMGKQLAV